jgi:predicted AAA+ superfamily ATPase
MYDPDYNISMWIARSIGPHILRLARSRPVIVLTGARQTGKTSLLRHLFPSLPIVSLDLPSEAEFAENDPRGFLSLYPPPVLIDEVQYAPSLFRHIKVWVDAHRSARGQFILTGSQKFTLMRAVSDSLAGRAQILELEPLSVAEISSSLPRPPVHEIILRGGFPEIHADPSIDCFFFYRSYIATYLERDVRNLLGVTSLRDFERFLRACALRTGQLLNKSDLARDTGISPSTANQWLSVLEASGQVALLEPWFSNKTKSITKSPKLYLTDTGLACALLNIRTAGDLRRSPLLGQLWETCVFAELRKQETARQLHWSIQYWRNRTREVDFVIDRGGRFHLYEAKWAENPRRGDADSLAFLSEELGLKNVDSR